MRTKFIRILIFSERKLRILLLSFCVYSLLYTVGLSAFPQYVDILHNPFYIIGTSIFSLCSGFVLSDELNDFLKKNGFDWTAKDKEEYYCYEFIGLVWIFAFYYMVQLGALIIFFPEFEQVTIGNSEHQLYSYLFAFNSIIIYTLYRCTILKIKTNDTNE